MRIVMVIKAYKIKRHLSCYYYGAYGPALLDKVNNGVCQNVVCSLAGWRV